MATTVTVTKNVVSAVLDTGTTTSSGATKTASVNLPTLKTSALSSADLDLIMAVVNAMVPIFEYSFINAKYVVTSTMETSA